MSAVLVIEDDDRIRLSLVLALEDEGYAAVGASTAEEGLSVQRTRPAETVLVDLMLPGIDGFECIRQLRRYDSVPVVLAAAGCGVPMDRTPRNIDDIPVPYRSGAPGDTGGRVIERLCFVQNGRLVRVVRRVPAVRPPQAQLRDMLAGPTAAESDDGLTSALTAASGLTVQVDGGRATVDVGGGRLEEGLGTDDVLAFGQIVCTLTSQFEIGTVTFTSNGEPLSVPRGDASLADGPVTIADYVGLLAS